MISPTSLLSADPNIMDILQRKHHQSLYGIGVGKGKLSPISETVQDSVLLLLTTGPIYMCVYTRFRLVPKSMTWDTLKGTNSLCYGAYH